MSNIPYANSSNADVTPSWVPTTDPGYQTASDVTTAVSGKQDTLSNGVGVTIHNNTVSIGQSVSNSASPIFNQLTLGNAGINEGVINLQDLTNIGIDTIANIKGILDGDNGGQLEFHTKEDGDSVTKKMSIKEDGKVVINRTLTIGPENPEGWSLIINGTNAASTGIGLCRNGQEQIGSMYISSNPDKDFVVDAYSPLSNMGILFRTGQGLNRFRIGVNGEFEVNGDSGSQNDVLTSNGPNAPPSWVSAPAAQLPKEAFNMRFNNKLNSYGAGLHAIGGYNASTIMAGTNANTGTGRYTATRAIWMNFMFVALQFNNTGGTNDMSQFIRRYNSAGTLLEECAGQTIPSNNDPLNILQATLSMNVVMSLNAGDFVLAHLGSSQPFMAYSLGANQSFVVFSGHNVD